MALPANTFLAISMKFHFFDDNTAVFKLTQYLVIVIHLLL